MINNISRLAGDETIAAAIMAGRGDYELAAGYQAIMSALRK